MLDTLRLDGRDTTLVLALGEAGPQVVHFGAALPEDRRHRQFQQLKF